MGAWALLLPLLLAVARAQVCSVNRTSFEIEENTVLREPLVEVQVPLGQHVELGPSSTPEAFRIQGNQLFLNVTPDYEDKPMLLAHLLCKRGDTVVTQLNVFVAVRDVNDNPPVFPFEVKRKEVPEDTRVNTTVIPREELEATDLDKSDILFYTLQEVTPGAGSVFSLVGTNLPALRLDQRLDFDRTPNMTLLLRVRDTREENAQPSHSATATLVLEVQPADLRPPWFLPCLYSDPHVCVQPQYHGAVPTGHTLPAALILRPGPIYAIDGDRGINQPIIYSILSGNQDDTFVLNATSGNLTMARSVPSPKTFGLLVKAEQEDRARYSVTRVTVEARAAAGSPPRFPQGLYRGAALLGSGAGVPVRDAADPAQPLRIQAQDPEFPDLNSAIAYRVTNNSLFRMDGEAVLTAVPLGQAGVFYAEVQANNTVTGGTATTTLEVRVSEPAPPPTAPPGSPTPPETARTTRPSSSSTTEAPRPPDPSQTPSTTTTSSGGVTTPHPPSSSSTPGPPRPPDPSQTPSTTSAGGSTGPHPPSGTTVKPPPASSTPGSPSSAGPSTAPSSASSTSNPGSPGAGGGVGDGDHWEERRFSAAEMGALGGVLGALLLLALLALALLVHRHYGARVRCCSGKALEPQPLGFDNKAFLPDDREPSWYPGPGPGAPAEVPPAPAVPAPPTPPVTRAPPSPRPSPASSAPPSPRAAPRAAPASPAAGAPDEGGPAGVRSILTKERRPEGGYKAVWFGEGRGAAPDVVVLNAPAWDADGDSGGESGGESGGDSSGDEDAAAGPAWGPRADAPGTDSTYI